LAHLPIGPYAVGVSGGADSVALLLLLRQYRPDLPVHVVHLNHETRGDESDADAAFVAALAGQLSVPVTVARRRDVEPQLADRPSNPSALYRALRLALFADVCHRHGLAGVLLAHHALDQAETVLHRLLRGSGPTGLAGMAEANRLPVPPDGSLVVHRPLLGVPPDALRQYLVSRGQAWREDASNRSPRYARNRLRRVLSGEPDLVAALLDASKAFAGLREWLRSATPALDETFDVDRVAGLPDLLAAEAARAYLTAAGAPTDDLTPAVLARLVAMARDAASPPRQHFPGKILVRRRRGEISRVAE
jgi:tRNA(Ile)-lysidine synthetase-like protein